jgi:hypothetical protein
MQYLFLARCILSAVLVASLDVCAKPTKSPITGVVVDMDSGQPIASAFVIAQWIRYGRDAVGSRTSCLGVEVVQADESGRFRIPVENSPGRNFEPIVFSYSPAYQWAGRKIGVGTQTLNMSTFKGTPSQRFSSFETYASLRECGQDSKSLESLRTLYRRIDEEIAQLAPEPEKVSPTFGRQHTLIEMLDRLQNLTNAKKDPQ